MKPRFKVGDRVRIKPSTSYWSGGRTGIVTVVREVIWNATVFWYVVRLDRPYHGIEHVSCPDHHLTRAFSAVDVVDKLMNEQ